MLATDPHPALPSIALARAALVAPVALVLIACPGDDAPTDTEATAGSSTGASTTDDGPDPDSTTAAVSSSSSSSTTEPLDDTGTTTTTDTTGDPPSDGLCEGYEQVGYIATVLSRDGMPIDTSCDPTPAPCGGDPVGIWAVESTCGFEAFPNPLEDVCPGSTFVVEILSQMGTMTFVDDGSFVQDFEIQAQVVATLDSMACFGVDCATFEQLSQMDNPGTTCVAMGPNCECTIPDDGMPEQAMGTWQVMGNDIVLTTVEGSQALPFCIGGDRLDLWQALLIPTVTDVLCMDEQDCIDALGDMYDFYVCSLDAGPGG
jgi:hypothetical protein